MGAVAALAGGSIVGGLLQARAAEKAAGKAASAQARAQQQSISEQRRQFDIGTKKLEPFRQAELRSLDEQQALTGMLGEEAQQAAIDRISDSPATRFARERGEQSLLRQASAIGGIGGSRVREALQQQAIGYAQQDLQTQLRNISGQGSGATSSQVSLGSNLASNVSRGLENIGQARAGGILGAAQARNQGIGAVTQGLGAIAGYMQGGQNLSSLMV